MNIINNSQVLGSPSKDLVLNTLGKVYVRTGDRYYELDFRNSPVQSDTDVNTDSAIESNISESDVVITKSISDLEYPGDNKFVISLDGKFYITTKGRYKNVTPSNSLPESVNNLTITSLTDVNVIGQLYSDGLIVDFLSNKITVDSLEVDKISAKSINVSNLNVASNDTFISGSGKLYIGPELSIYDVDLENDLVYFYTKAEFDPEIFPKKELITDNTESFVCEIVDVTSDYILGRLISGEVNDPSKIILKGDHIRYDSTWKSFYDKTYNLRFNHILNSGDYSDLELATVNSNVSLTLKPGTLIKCLSDCTIDVTVNEINNKYQLYKNVLYLINDTNCINLTDSIRYFKTKQEFDNIDRKTIDVAFIEDTEQIYYNGLLVGGKQSASLPDNFKIENATTGAIIVNKDGIWQPSYDYVTTQYVNDQVKDLIDNAPDALNTFNKIAIVIQNNANRIDEIYRLLGSNVSIDELNAKLDEINSQLDAIDVNNIITVLDDKASWAYVKNLEDGLSEFATKAWVESAIETYLKPTQNNTSSSDISNIQTSINKIQSKLNEHTSDIELLKTKDNKFNNSIQSLISDYNQLSIRVDELESKSEIVKPSSSEVLIGGYPVKIGELLDGHVLTYSSEIKAWVTRTVQDESLDDLFELDENGNIHIKNERGIWSDSFITSGGINGSNSGSGYNRLDSWSDYTSSRSTDVLSAQLGYSLYTDVEQLKNGASNGINETELDGLLTRWQYVKKSDGDKWYASKQSTEDRLTALENMWEITSDGLHAKNGLGVYSDSFVTGGGINSSSSGSSIVNRLDTWDSYTSSKASYVLSASLGYDLHSRLTSVEDNLGNVNIDLSDYVTKTSFSEHKIEFSNHINTYNNHVTAYNNHITSYNQHISDYNTHVANYTTWKASVDKIMSVLEIDSAGDLHVKKGLYSDSFVTAGGKNGTSSSSALTRFDGPWTSYTNAKATNVLSASLGKDLDDRLTYLENNGVGNSGSTSVTWGSITGKPTFATVATSGSYNDLSNKPSIPSLSGYATESWVSNNYQTKGNYLTSVSWGIVTGKPTFASVATSGSYNDLSNKPTIPTNLNQLTNGPGYITGINSSMVTSALGYTPYNSANFTKSNIKSTLGISDWALASTKPSYKTSEITEQTNLYFTNARAVAAMSNATISGNLTVTGIVTGQVDCVGGSDIRYKTIIENIDVTSKIFDEILNAPLFKFKWNNSDKIYIGTSAQYWANTELKDVVKYDPEKDFNYLSYQSLAFGIGKINSSIIKSHATKLSEQNERIIKLEAQVEELQTKLIEHGIE